MINECKYKEKYSDAIRSDAVGAFRSEAGDVEAVGLVHEEASREE
jgi:hypothetical protein